MPKSSARRLFPMFKRHLGVEPVLVPHFFVKPSISVIKMAPCLSSLMGSFEYVSVTFGMALNALLVYLVLYKTNRELRVYSKALLCNCVTDVSFAVVCLLVDFVSPYFVLETWLDENTEKVASILVVDASGRVVYASRISAVRRPYLGSYQG